MTSPASTPAWIAAPIATTSSGLTPLWGSLPKNDFDHVLDLGNARRAADEHDLVDVDGLDARRPASARSHGPSVRFEDGLDELLEARPIELELRGAWGRSRPR